MVFVLKGYRRGSMLRPVAIRSISAIMASIKLHHHPHAGDGSSSASCDGYTSDSAEGLLSVADSSESRGNI